MDNTDYFMLEDWRFGLISMVDKWTECYVSVFLKNFFFDTLFGNLHVNHFGQNVLHLLPKQKGEKKKEENYIS